MPNLKKKHFLSWEGCSLDKAKGVLKLVALFLMWSIGQKGVSAHLKGRDHYLEAEWYIPEDIERLSVRIISFTHFCMDFEENFICFLFLPFLPLSRVKPRLHIYKGCATLHSNDLLPLKKMLLKRRKFYFDHLMIDQNGLKQWFYVHLI